MSDDGFTYHVYDVGTHTVTFPEDTIADVLLVGGGGGGSNSKYPVSKEYGDFTGITGGGGGGGEVNIYSNIKFKKGVSYSFKVGKGGKGITGKLLYKNAKKENEELLTKILNSQNNGPTTEFDGENTTITGDKLNLKSKGGGSATPYISNFSETKFMFMGLGGLSSGNIGGTRTILGSGEQIVVLCGGGASVKSNGGFPKKPTYLKGGIGGKGADGKYVPSFKEYGDKGYFGAGGSASSISERPNNGGKGGGGTGSYIFIKDNTVFIKNGSSGEKNTGGGGGGALVGVGFLDNSLSFEQGYNGGSGVIILRYKKFSISIKQNPKLELKQRRFLGIQELTLNITGSFKITNASKVIFGSCFLDKNSDESDLRELLKNIINGSFDIMNGPNGNSQILYSHIENSYTINKSSETFSIDTQLNEDIMIMLKNNQFQKISTSKLEDIKTLFTEPQSSSLDVYGNWQDIDENIYTFIAGFPLNSKQVDLKDIKIVKTNFAKLLELKYFIGTQTIKAENILRFDEEKGEVTFLEAFSGAARDPQSNLPTQDGVKNDIILNNIGFVVKPGAGDKALGRYSKSSGNTEGPVEILNSNTFVRFTDPKPFKFNQVIGSFEFEYYNLVRLRGVSELFGFESAEKFSQTLDVIFPPEFEITSTITTITGSGSSTEKNIKIHIDFESYVQDVSLTLDKNDGTQLGNISDTVNNASLSRVYSFTIDDLDNEFVDLSVNVTATNTLGKTVKSTTKSKEIEENNATPILNDISFLSPTAVEHNFDISTSFVDLFDNNQRAGLNPTIQFNPLNLTFPFSPKLDNVNIPQVLHTERVQDASNYVYTVVLDYSEHLTQDEDLSFNVEILLIDDTTFTSNTISKTYKLPTPDFSLEIISTRNTTSNPDPSRNILEIKDLTLDAPSSFNYTTNDISYEDVEYIIDLSSSVYDVTTINPPQKIIDNLTSNDSLNIEASYYFGNEVDILVTLKYKGVSGGNTVSKTISSPKIIPFKFKALSPSIKNTDQTTITLVINSAIVGRVDKYEFEVIDTTTNDVITDISKTISLPPQKVFDFNEITTFESLSNINDTLIVNNIDAEITINIADIPAEDINNLELVGRTYFDDVSSIPTTVDNIVTPPKVNDVSLNQTRPDIINILFNVAEVDKELWDNPNGFVSIHQYDSDTDFNAIDIPDSSFTIIKQSNFNSTIPNSKVQTLNVDGYDYIINSKNKTTNLLVDHYYAYYIRLGAIIDGKTYVFDEPTKIKKKIETNLIKNNLSLDFSFNSSIGFGNISVLDNNDNTDGEDIFNVYPSTGYPDFYDFKPNDILYDTIFTHNQTSNISTETYSNTSTPPTVNGEFPVGTSLERVDDTSLVEIKIAPSYNDLSNSEVVFNISLATLIKPNPITDLVVKKVDLPNQAKQFVEFEFNHSGIAEEFKILAFNIGFGQFDQDSSAIVQSKYVIGNENPDTFSYDVKIEDSYLEADVCYSIIPRFFGAEGPVVEKAVSFTFEATDVSFYLTTPTNFEYEFTICGELHRERTNQTSIFIGISDNNIAQPLDVDPEDEFAIFRDNSGVLQRFKRDYPFDDGFSVGTDICGAFFGNQQLTDLCNNLAIELVPDKYYYFSISPIVDISFINSSGDIVVSPVDSPPSHVTKIQLPDLSGVDVSLNFYQEYTSVWQGEYSAEEELTRFAIPNEYNILEIEYKIWNGWPERLRINIFDGSLANVEGLEPDLSAVILTNRITDDVSGDNFSPRDDGFNVYEQVSKEFLEDNYQYYPVELENFDNTNIVVSDTSFNLYTLEDHILLKYVDSSNVTVQVLPERTNFNSKEETIQQERTPVKPRDISSVAFKAKNLWTTDEQRKIHIYLDGYNWDGIDLEEEYLENFEFRLTARDVSKNEFLTTTFDNTDLNNYRIALDTDISFSFNSSIVFSFDASYSREEETDKVDISLVAFYFDQSSNTVEASLNLISSKPEIVEKDVPNAITNPIKDPRSISLTYRFNPIDDLIGINIFEFKSSEEITGNIQDIPDTSFSLLKTEEAELSVGGDDVSFNTFNSNEGLEEFQYYYFKIQGIYGTTTTTKSDVIEAKTEELLKRPDISLIFVGNDTTFYQNELDNGVNIERASELPPDEQNTEEYYKLIYPINRRTISFEDVSFTQGYTLDFSHRRHHRDITINMPQDLLYVDDYHEDKTISVEITPFYENIILSPSATQTLSAETLVVTEIGINNSVIDGRATNLQLDWLPIPFGTGYRIWRDIEPGLLPEPSYETLNPLYQVNNQNITELTDTKAFRKTGKVIRFDPFVYYSIQTRYSFTNSPTITKFSDKSPIYFSFFEMGCICPLPGLPLMYNTANNKKQMSSRRRIAQKLSSGRKYW